MSDPCVIEELLNNTFSKRTFEERLLIIKNGRPTPELPNMSSPNKKCTRHFQTKTYEKKTWLTGCPKLNKLFCWPCLLFNLDKNIWNNQGYSDLNNLFMALLKHERSQVHINCVIDLKTFGNIRIDLQLDAQKRQTLVHHNEKVRKNRALMKRLIDAAIFLGKQELPFWRHFESDYSSNRGNYMEFLLLLSKYDEPLANHLNTSSIFTGMSNKIQNNLIYAIQETMYNEIAKEINQAKFVAILLDDTPDLSNHSRLSTVLRYVTKSGIVKERFICFEDVSTDRSAKTLSELVFKCIQTWKCESKLVAQTYDGAATMARYLNALQAKVRERYPFAIFIHCYAHVLNLVLSHACSEIKECKIFFSSITGLSTFFTTSPKRTSALDQIVKKRFLNATPTGWMNSSHLVNATKENRDALIILFQKIIENPENWDGITINAANGFSHDLQDPNFQFLMELFNDLFSYTDVLFNILQTMIFDITYCKDQVEKTKIMLENKLSMDHFVTFYNNLEEKYDIGTKFQSKRKNNALIDPQQFYNSLYIKIIHTVIDQLEIRYESLEELKFLELFNVGKTKEYQRNFPEAAFNSLKTSYGHFFDIISLRSELCVLYSRKEFTNQNVFKLIQYLHSNDLADAMPELYKLCELVATIPPINPSVEHSFSALNRIKSYQRKTTEEKGLSCSALMSIEKDLLQNLTRKTAFYETVIDMFAKRDRRLELNINEVSDQNRLRNI